MDDASDSAPRTEPPTSERDEQLPAHSPAPSKRGGSYTFLVVVSALGLALDLWSKWWAKSTFENSTKRSLLVIDGFMSFTFARNKGGAWGILQGETETIRRSFFLVISVVAIVFIVSLYRKLVPGQRALKWGLPLVLGGALGNLIDRIRYGWVIDFIDCYVGTFHWPTFNVADIAICVGVGLMAIDMFSSRAKRKLARQHGDSAPSDAGAVVGASADPSPPEG